MLSRPILNSGAYTPLKIPTIIDPKIVQGLTRKLFKCAVVIVSPYFASNLYSARSLASSLALNLISSALGVHAATHAVANIAMVNIIIDFMMCPYFFSAL